MSDKILLNVNGEIVSKSVLTVSGGSSDAGKTIGTDLNGKIDMSLMPSGIGADTTTLLASESLNIGDFVNIWDDAGTIKVRKADNSDSTKVANGFVKVAVASGSNAVIYTEGDNDTLTGLAVGTRYFLGVTGSYTSTVPTILGSIIQSLGTVKNPTTIRFEQKDPIKNA